MTETAPAVEALSWAVRDSFVHYVTMLSHGTAETSGGAQRDGAGRFVFPVDRLDQDGDDWRIAFRGAVRFQAHHGFLDVQLHDPHLVVGPSGGVLLARTAADSRDLVPLVVTPGVPPVYDEGVLHWSGLPSQLTGSAVGLFGETYEAGTPFAPIEISVRLPS
ncbi:HtaA domain-containing protein [Rathayibacter sp. VKM Ac-2835]|uniref:HtaA domain-containing protein n=1 Tax=Rathayibacter sp. VKM Ac-2835 TaxID=2739043 RepID=UPI0015665C26|nr:HtaA domain-containing protein [Rathayibacter sp. VKM Ac-2835]